ncbi:eukaryotic translation initiation factor 3, variant [Capsaspora owczarzaki ATCC 30864]|nr:eukaryotic translation initiation factor 3, variant [Capsaspora owczarzaki ATCC 30864]
MRAGTQNNQWNNQRGGRGGYYGQGRRAGGYGRGDGRLNRGNAWSVEVQPEWKLLEEIDFGKLNNLQMTVQDPEELGLYGNVGVFDRAFDTLTTKSDKALVSTSRFFNRVTAIDDPVLREHAKNGGQVFATDNVIAAIMSCTRSVYSFDIVVEKIGDKLFLYQRDNSDLDFLTVDETSPDPPHDDGDGSINAPRKLAVEATLVNQYFTQQVLKKNSIVSIGKSNPFLDTVPEKAEAAAVGYRYRRWNIGTDLNLVCRCEVDGLLVSKKPEELTEDTDAFVMVKALTEYDSKASGSLDWRQKLDIQRGALLATALKNNLFKVCRWAAAASLSGASQIRVGFVSRASPRDNTRHTVLGTSSLRPKELAQQINFQLSNGWAVLRTVIDACRKQTDGKYLLLKDPSKRSIVLYSIPQGTFEEASDDEEEEDDDTVNEFASDIAPSQADEAEQ